MVKGRCRSFICFYCCHAMRRTWASSCLACYTATHAVALTSKYLRPVSSNRYCILPSTIIMGFLKCRNSAADVKQRLRQSYWPGLSTLVACERHSQGLR